MFPILCPEGDRGRAIVFVVIFGISLWILSGYRLSATIRIPPTPD